MEIEDGDMHGQKPKGHELEMTITLIALLLMIAETVVAATLF